MLKLGAAKKEAGRAWSLADIRVPETDKELAANGFSFRVRRDGCAGYAAARAAICCDPT